MPGQGGTADAEQVPVQPKEQNSVQGVGGEVATKGPSARHYTIALPRVRRTRRPPRPPLKLRDLLGCPRGAPGPFRGFRGPSRGAGDALDQGVGVPWAVGKFSWRCQTAPVFRGFCGPSRGENSGRAPTGSGAVADIRFLTLGETAWKGYDLLQHARAGVRSPVATSGS